LIGRLATQKTSWGCRRIQGELVKLARRSALPPSVSGGNPGIKMPHRRALAAVPPPQTATMVAADLFHIDCAITLQRLYSQFVIEVGSRCGLRVQLIEAGPG
jgi:putative transposase